MFVPTGSAAFDFYGANRLGDNLFANCLLALDAATGKRVWHFQFVRHDVWDRDLPAAPTLVEVRQNGRVIDALAQLTKYGRLWLLDRPDRKTARALRNDSPPTEATSMARSFPPNTGPSDRARALRAPAGDARDSD